MALERELKLDVGPEFHLPDLSATMGLTVVTEPDKELDATYYDTTDLRLARWGATLRYRTTDGGGGRWTLKLPASGTRITEGGLARDELDFDSGPSSPPVAATRLALTLHRGSALAPVARLTTIRRTHALLDAAGARLAEIDEDRVTYWTPSGRQGTFSEVEVELEQETPDAVLDKVADVLTKADATRAGKESKLVRALGGLPEAEVSVRPVERDATVAELVARAVTSGVHRLIVNDPGVRAGSDPESVHQARVATRRLRSDLKTLEDALEGTWASGLRGGLRETGALLGAVRDADVLMGRLTDAVEQLPEADRAPAGTLLVQLSSQREEARRTLVAYMESRDYIDLVETLIGASGRQPVTHPGEPAARLFPLVSRRWRKLKRRVAALDDEPSDTDLHRVRIDAKRCRYAAELMAPVAGRKAEALAAALADLQSVLGDLHDAAVAEQWLRQAAPRARPDEALVIGELAALERRSQVQLRSAWTSTWASARKKKLRAWLR